MQNYETIHNPEKTEPQIGDNVIVDGKQYLVAEVFIHGAKAKQSKYAHFMPCRKGVFGLEPIVEEETPQIDEQPENVIE